MIWDNHDPDFVKQFEVDYYFEETQKFELAIYDCDDENAMNDPNKHDFIGSYEFVLGHIVSAPNQTVTDPFKSQHGKPKVVVNCEEKKNLSSGSTAIM